MGCKETDRGRGAFGTELVVTSAARRRHEETAIFGWLQYGERGARLLSCPWRRGKPPFGEGPMSFCRAFLAFALCVTAPAFAAAQQARQIEVGYEITFAGIAGFRIDVTARFNGAAYDVQTHTSKEAPPRALTMRYARPTPGSAAPPPQPLH